MTMTTHN